jgi:hypothetical protein
VAEEEGTGRSLLGTPLTPPYPSEVWKVGRERRQVCDIPLCSYPIPPPQPITPKQVYNPKSSDFMVNNKIKENGKRNA